MSSASRGSPTRRRMKRRSRDCSRSTTSAMRWSGAIRSRPAASSIHRCRRTRARKIVGRRMAEAEPPGWRESAPRDGGEALAGLKGAVGAIPNLAATMAEALVQRLHREAVGGVLDDACRKLLEEILGYPGVPKRWRTPELGAPLVPVLPVR